jgi:phenylpyruvate tautomerase PptA (4-oxalocrotonate tautomerase family)
MPHMRLYATAGRTPEQKRALMEAAHQGLVEGAGIPEWDRQVRLLEFGPDNILLPDSDDTESYVLVEVIGYPRSLEVKRDIYRAIVKHLSTVGVDPSDTKITYYDVPPDAWGVNGGQAGSDVAAAQASEGTSDWSARY